MQVQSGTGPGVRRSKIPLSACIIRTSDVQIAKAIPDILQDSHRSDLSKNQTNYDIRTSLSMIKIFYI